MSDEAREMLYQHEWWCDAPVLNWRDDRGLILGSHQPHFPSAPFRLRRADKRFGREDGDRLVAMLANWALRYDLDWEIERHGRRGYIGPAAPTELAAPSQRRLAEYEGRHAALRCSQSGDMTLSYTGAFARRRVLFAGTPPAEIEQLSSRLRSLEYSEARVVGRDVFWAAGHRDEDALDALAWELRLPLFGSSWRRTNVAPEFPAKAMAHRDEAEAIQSVWTAARSWVGDHARWYEPPRAVTSHTWGTARAAVTESRVCLLVVGIDD